MKRKARVLASAAVLLGFLAGFLFPERMSLPVEGASRADWNGRSFWHSGWGVSGVHKGIDIFAPEGTPVLSSTAGIVLCAGSFGLGGTVIVLLGPKWRIHYYAHLRSVEVRPGSMVARGVKIGTVGTTGNAAGKAPHLHYSILTLFPYPWHAAAGPQGWKRMFFLDPGKRLAWSQILTKCPWRQRSPGKGGATVDCAGEGGGIRSDLYGNVSVRASRCQGAQRGVPRSGLWSEV